jgi:hypothetical protein
MPRGTSVRSARHERRGLATLAPKPRCNLTMIYSVFASSMFVIQHQLLRIGEVQITSNP